LRIEDTALKSTTRCRVAALLTAIVSLTIVASAAAQPVRLPGTRVSLEPPSGFTPATQFSGFQNATVPASILVTELPGPAAAMKQGMTREALASRGMTLVQSSTARVDGDDASLLQVRQASSAGEVVKWMLIAGNAHRTVMIVGTYPATADSVVGDEIRQSLLTARLGLAAATPDPSEGLSFHVTSTARLKVAGRVANLLTLTETGTLTPSGPDAALYFVGHSISNVEIPDLRAFSEARLGRTTRTHAISGVTGRPTTLSDLDAYEIEANATDSKTGRPVRIYQVIAPDPSGYFIVQGFVSPARAADMVPEFRKVTATFQRALR